MIENKADSRGVLSDLINVLSKHRKLLVVFYMLFLIAFVLAFIFFTSAVIPQFFHIVFGSPDTPWFSDWEIGKPPIMNPEGRLMDKGLYFWDKSTTNRIITIAIFFFLQVLFIWGEGYYHEPSRFVKIGKVTLLAGIGSCMAALLLGAILLSFLEFGDRYVGFIRGGTPIMAEKYKDFFDRPFPSSWFWQLVLGAWIFWLSVILVYTRWRNSHSFAPKLIGVIISGSFINSVISLMIDLSVRPRYIGCVFITGSWFALIISVPVLVWSIGPAIYLLYLIERRRIDTVSKQSRANEISNNVNEKVRQQ